MAKGIHEGKTLSRDNQRSGDWREILQSTYREEKSSGRIIFLGFGRCKIHGMGQLKNKSSKRSTLGNSRWLRKQKLLQQVLTPRFPDF